MREILFAFRRLLKDPWSASAAILVSALAVALTTATSAVGYGILVRPLPYTDARRLAVTDVSVPIGQLPSWKSAMPAFRAVSGYASEGFTVRGLSDPRFVPVAVVDDEFFETVGAAPLAGRTFRRDEGAVAVISRRFARESNADERSIVGRSIFVGDSQVTIVGVMPEAFGFPSDDIDAWVPARVMAPIRFDRSPDERRLRVFGRLNGPDALAEAMVEVDRARARFDPRSRRAADAASHVELVYERLVGPVRPALIALGAGAGLVFLIACANIATILVGRTVSRRRELAVRGAIGASRTQLLATTLSESLLVALSGGVLGVAVAWLAIHRLTVWAAGLVPRLADVRVDWPVLGFAFAGFGVSTILAALPALGAIEPAAAMLRTSAGETGRGVRLRAMLAVAQIALSVVLITGGALLARSIVALLHDDTGFDAGGTLVSRLMLTDAMNFNAAGRRAWLENVLDRIRQVPGVVDAGAGSSMPPAHATLVMTVRLQNNGVTTEVPELTFASVTPGYLRAVGMRLVRGRYFDERDDRRGDLVAILSESAARVLAPAADPSGEDLPFFLPGMRERGKATIVGVVADVKFKGLTDRPGPAVYVLWHELPASQLYLAVRTANNPRRVAADLRTVIHGVDANTPLMPIRTMSDEMARSVGDRRLRALVGGGVALLAFGIAVVGLAGGLARLVSERRHELAIRAALGASPGRTIASVMKEAAVLVAAGVATGLAVAYGVGRMLRAFLWGISAHDPITFAAVALCVTAIALAACYVPARAASRANPLELLRNA
jgi:predicted permease